MTPRWWYRLLHAGACSRAFSHGLLPRLPYSVDLWFTKAYLRAATDELRRWTP